MPLVVDQLQLWTIGFNWADLDPNRLWVRIPTPVRDNFSTLLEAILSDHLGCLTLASEKYKGDDPEVAKFYIRDWLDDVYAGIRGQYFNRNRMPPAEPMQNPKLRQYPNPDAKKAHHDFS